MEKLGKELMEPVARDVDDGEANPVVAGFRYVVDRAGFYLP